MVLKLEAKFSNLYSEALDQPLLIWSRMGEYWGRTADACNLMGVYVIDFTYAAQQKLWYVWVSLLCFNVGNFSC